MKDETSVLFGKWEVPLRRRLAWWGHATPERLFVASFAVLVLLGTVGLKALPGLYTGAGLSWADALFTATSATCVTGLVVVDTATHFTPLGQAYLLLLIQLGGLGMIAFTSLIIVAFGRRMSLRHEAMSYGTTEVAPHVGRPGLVRDVVAFTFVVEVAGAVVLYFLLASRHGWAGAAWPAVFHSVSAFCNAGFSTHTDSLIGYQGRPDVLAVIMGLIVVGGLGFLTLEELHLWRRAAKEGRAFRLSLHSRIVLAATAVLVVGGWALFALFEWGNTLGGMPVSSKVANALFLSVTARTAGFNAIDYGRASDGANFLTILLMMVGGSPGSTAGGIKTTTVVLMGLLAWSRLRGREVVEVQSRTVPAETVQRAVGLFVVAFGAVTVGIFVLTATEHRPGGAGGGDFLRYMFEVASAFNTVGLSMGTTPELSVPGRLVVAGLMFVGRVGPLTFAAALARRVNRAVQFRYASEDVVVG
jgi:trk system potassium uptake protein TrkH